MRRRIVAGVVSGCSLFGVALCLAWHGREAHATRSPVAGPPVLIAPGATEGASDAVDLGFQAAGAVAEVLIDEGESVHAGALLGRLDDGLERAHAAEARAGLLEATARRDATLAGARASERAMAEASLHEADVDAAERAKELKRVEQLLSSDAIGSAEVDRVRAASDASAARAASARAHWKLVVDGARSEERREAEAAVVAAEARLREAEVLLSRTELRAPRDGVVLRRYVEPGEEVALLPPTVAFKMADRSHLRVRAEVDEEDVAKVHVGQRGFCTAAAFGERRFEGTVVRILGDLGRKHIVDDNPRARTSTRVLEAILDLDGDPPLPVGLRLDVHLPAKGETP